MSLLTMVRHMAGTLGFAAHAEGAQGVWKGVAIFVGASEAPPLMRVRADLLAPLDLGLEVRSWRAQPLAAASAAGLADDGFTARAPFVSRALGPRFYVSVHEIVRAEALFDHDVAWALADAANWGILLNDFCTSIEVPFPVPDAVPLAIRCLSRVARRVDRARRRVPPPAWGYAIYAAMCDVARRLGLEVLGCPVTLRGNVGEISVVGGPTEMGAIRMTAYSRDGATAEPGRAPSPAMLPLIRDLQARGVLGFDANKVVWTSGTQVSGADLGVGVEMLVSLTRKWFGLEDGGPYR